MEFRIGQIVEILNAMEDLHRVEEAKIDDEYRSGMSVDDIDYRPFLRLQTIVGILKMELVDRGYFEREKTIDY